MSSLDTAPPSSSLYGYTPTTSVCFIFIGLFAISALIHGCEAVAYKLWWLLPLTCLAGLGEVIGWLGRLWSSFTPADLNPYTIQICATIISPTPLIASNFIILGKLIQHLGIQFSRITPRLYSIIFTSADVIALIIQAFGGAIAARAVQNNGDPDRGGHIMLIGIVIQMVAITVYVSLASEFFFRFYSRRPIHSRGYPPLTEAGVNIKPRLEWKIQLMIFALGLSTLCLFIRTVYRTVELSNGFEGPIIRTEILFNVLDGAMVCIASYTINFLHPGYLLAEVIKEQKRGHRKGNEQVPLMQRDSWASGKSLSNSEV